MKKIFTLLLLLVASIGLSQNSGITYQAVIYGPNGQQLPGANNQQYILANKTICLRFSIIDQLGTVEYQETIVTTTDKFGMVNLLIGTGTQVSGYAPNFAGIVWNANTKSLKVELDPSQNCQNFTQISNNPFTYVPFAYFSANPGLPGPAGPAGPAGPQGIQGVAGATGNNGAQGIQGIQGLSGPQGPIGLTGATGPQGPIGLTGATGATGPQGIQGVAGTNGTNGTNGLSAYQIWLNAGNTGTEAQFLTSLQGATGPQGSQGLQGQQGIPGTNGINGIDGAIGPQGPIGLTGQAGATGPQGPIGLTGSAGATGPVGPIGLTGPVGPQGLQGIQGITGPTGVIGPTGATGPQGIAGINGANGSNGLSAYQIWLNAGNNGTEAQFLTSLQGATGSQGMQGIPGINGTNGTNGVDGKNTLVNITTELAGANCANGGTKIEVGLDANNNSVLDSGEINNSLTKYVCNGNSFSSNSSSVPLNFDYTGAGLYFSPEASAPGWNYFEKRIDTIPILLNSGIYSIGLDSDWGSVSSSGCWSADLFLELKIKDNQGIIQTIYVSTDLFNVNSSGGLGVNKRVINGSSNFRSIGKFSVESSGQYTITVRLMTAANNCTSAAGTLNSYRIKVTNMY